MPPGVKTALRALPLGPAALVVWREKPWTVQLSASAPWAVVASILVNFVVFLPLKAARWRVAVGSTRRRSARFWPRPSRVCSPMPRSGSAAATWCARRACALPIAARWRWTMPPPGRSAAPRCSALAVLVFVAALVGNLGAVALALSGLAVAAYVAVLQRRAVSVRAAARALAAGAARAVGGAGRPPPPRRVAAMAALSLLGWTAEIGMLMLFQVAFHLEPSVRTALLTLVGDQRRHRDPGRARDTSAPSKPASRWRSCPLRRAARGGGCSTPSPTTSPTSFPWRWWRARSSSTAPWL